VHEGQSVKREMEDGHEGSDEAAGNGEISTLLTSVPGLAAVGTFSADVAILVALEAVLDAGAAALVEPVTEGVLNVIGGVLKVVFDFLVIALFRAHVAVSFQKGAAESAMPIAVLEVGVGADLVWVVVVGVEMVVSCAGTKGVGTRVEAGHGNGTLVASEEGEEMVGLIPMDGEVLKDLGLMGNEAS
jgi:hypothetical protein